MDPKQVQKKREQFRREQNRHRWISILSWGTLFMAFGSFFGIWHHLGTASAQTTASAASTTVGNAVLTPNSDSRSGDNGSGNQNSFDNSQGGVDNSQGGVGISQDQQPIVISGAS